MGRAPCCEKIGLKKGRWSAEEDEILSSYIATHGEGSWRSLPKNAGLLRCGKSCRLRWINYLRGDLKRGNISREEEDIIIKLHASIGNRWSVIAQQLPGRTDNEIKNHWNSHLSRRIDTFRKLTREGAAPAAALAAAAAGANSLARRGKTSRATMKKSIITNIARNSVIPTADHHRHHHHHEKASNISKLMKSPEEQHVIMTNACVVPSFEDDRVDDHGWSSLIMLDQSPWSPATPTQLVRQENDLLWVDARDQNERSVLTELMNMEDSTVELQKQKMQGEADVEEDGWTWMLENDEDVGGCTAAPQVSDDQVDDAQVLESYQDSLAWLINFSDIF